jgi:metal-responsive CopG/Arc/MetJ family transcriptional regulator
MPQTKGLRQSISLPTPIARRVQELAKNRHNSASRVLVELIEAGLESKEQEKKRFFELADRLETSEDPVERQKIKEALAKLTFGN